MRRIFTFARTEIRVLAGEYGKNHAFIRSTLTTELRCGLFASLYDCRNFFFGLCGAVTLVCWFGEVEVKLCMA